MAIKIANPDGTSNAKPGDVVITGGGIFKKNEDGSSTKLESLNDFIGKATTKNYSDLSKIAESYAARESVRGGSSSNSKVDYSNGSEVKPSKEETYKPTAIDDNGILTGQIVGFTPIDYSDSSRTGSSSGVNKILGYVIVGLVGLALLDRFMNPKKK